MTSRRTPGTAPVIEGFTPRRLLGIGGHADVFLYSQQVPARPVAVKVAAPGSQPHSAELFNNEAQLMSLFPDKINIVQLYVSGVASDGRSYLVMEYCGGPSLDARYRTEQIPVIEALLTGVQLALALATVHERGILHRDIKPSNVLATTENVTKLADFGNSIRSQSAAGAPGGMSIPWVPPELLGQDPLASTRSDIYSLGATVYSALAGRPPFEIAGGSNTDADLLSRAMRGQLPLIERDDMPESVNAVLARAMDRNPANRYPTAQDLATVLRQIASDLNGDDASVTENGQQPKTEVSVMPVLVNVEHENQDVTHACAPRAVGPGPSPESFRIADEQPTPDESTATTDDATIVMSPLAFSPTAPADDEEVPNSEAFAYSQNAVSAPTDTPVSPQNAGFLAQGRTTRPSGSTPVEITPFLSGTKDTPIATAPAVAGPIDHVPLAPDTEQKAEAPEILDEPRDHSYPAPKAIPPKPEPKTQPAAERHPNQPPNAALPARPKYPWGMPAEGQPAPAPQMPMQFRGPHTSYEQPPRPVAPGQQVPHLAQGTMPGPYMSSADVMLPQPQQPQQQVPVPAQPIVQPLPPEPRRTKKIMALIASSIVVIGAGTGVFIAVNNADDPALEETGASSSSTSIAPVEAAVPSPTEVKGEEQEEGEVVFTWTNPMPEDGDQYQWGVVAEDTETMYHLIDDPLVTVPAAQAQARPLCIEVSIVRADRRASPEPAEGCLP